MRWISSFTTLAVFVSVFAAIPTCRADSGRVAVVVLAYNGDAASHFGEGALEKWLGLNMKPEYDNVYFVRGADTTPANIRAKMTAALATGKTVDFMSTSHSGGSYVYYDGYMGTPEDLLAPVINDSNRGQLGLAANFGCDNVAEVDQFSRLGFKSFIGHDDTSAGAFTMNMFLENWLGCRDLATSAGKTSRRMQQFMNDHKLQSFIFDKMGFSGGYRAELKAFGANQRLCDPAQHAQMTPVAGDFDFLPVSLSPAECTR